MLYSVMARKTVPRRFSLRVEELARSFVGVPGA
jgi:hypothetical protein